jgi:hypothetical protein
MSFYEKSCYIFLPMVLTLSNIKETVAAMQSIFDVFGLLMPIFQHKNVNLCWRLSRWLCQANMQQIKHKGLPMSKIYQNQNLSGEAATTNGVRARCVNIVPIGFESLSVPYMTLETRLPADPAILFLPIRLTVVQNATITSTSIWTIWPCPEAVIHTGSFQWRYDWSSKMDCRTARHHGICGETIEFLFPGLRFRTGLKRRGEKSEAAIRTDYIDHALSDFSGYIAADELYDGPFCVLFIVDNHKFKRLYYEVLDHDPTNGDIKRFFGCFEPVA